ncbi:LysM peptidoglycan-binding domain-containing protein [Streptomyces poriferorum]|uniref:LysM peptidoglycan-binding domain-containing protein n=1 Tax=Streptomyces poriferorum TaxID=2798799 RepID=A0ABY9J460_9ACTN|nr:MULTISPECIES: LysM peptidoglycan-binding domain-containing protein [unclassified Streptomyces]MDP5309328.1 LysM peptidoglycan-binding domain-containing protein [Streptomyces sp. Alt4]WLQ61466.1 LysM peptidoglycan-binding domain-containing protein [Streptomyces sp. Alt2]
MPQHPRHDLHHRHTRPQRAAGGALVTALRAVVSLLVLAALLAGLPLLLWWGTQVVAPSGIAALGNLLSTQDSGQVFLLALAVAGWIGWALFALSVLVEIPAQLRGRTAPQLRLLIGQRTAAALVGAILLALPTGTALAASAAPASASPPVAAAARPGPAAADTAADQSQKADEVRQATHIVRTARPAESLWSIAAARLGDGNRWEEIASLNQGRTMADGQTFRADSPIQPGWSLSLPEDARPAADAAPSRAADALGADAETDGGTRAQSAASKPAAAQYTVESGDSLSLIAQAELGDAAQYPEIFALNKGKAQPGGHRFTDPDKIFPGQHLTLPSHDRAHDNDDTGGGAERSAHPDSPVDTDRSETPNPGPDTETPAPAKPDSDKTSQATPPAEHTAPAPDSRTTTPAPASTSPTAPAEKPSATTVPSARPSADTPSATPSTAPAAPTAPATTPTAAPAAAQESGPLLRQGALVAGIGALLAASLAGALGVKRVLQQRRRRAGETIAIDPDATLLEQVLNTGAEPSGVTLLDTALRTLSHHTDPTAGHLLPAVRGARISGRTVHLLPDDQNSASVSPFIFSELPGSWALDPSSSLLDADAAREVPAPYPGLVTLGATASGDLILSNLLHHRVLLLDGGADDVLAVARALALEAGTCAWTDHTEIVTVGLGARLATLLPKGRVRTMPHLQSVVADLGALLVEVHQQSGTDDAPQPLPWILICVGDLDAEQVWQLADAVSAARGLPLAVVMAATDASRQAFPDAELIPTTAQSPIEVPQLSSAPIQLQRLEEEQYRQFIHALEVADEPATPATGAWKLAEDHDQAATAPRPPAVFVPGPDGSADPGNPFPALLASAPPQRSEGPAADGTPTDTAGPATESDGAAGAPDAAEQTQDGASAPGAGPEDMAGPDAGSRPVSGAPEISVLGPLRVSGISSSGHGPKVAALAALIHLRPGRSAEALCTAMDPVSPWSTRTLQSRLSELRSRFGNTPDGVPYLPRPKHGYTLHAAVRSDWDAFQELATRGLAAGPARGLPDLEHALGLVRGKPFDGQDYPWADSVQQEMLSRITDIAHTLAAWHSEGDTPDMDAARQAALRGLDIEETAEVLYRDWMNIEWAIGNTAGLRKAIARMQQTARTYDISLEPITEQLIALVLSESPTPAPAQR